MKAHTHRAVANSFRGRQLAQAKGARIATPVEALPADVRAHNEEIERRRQEDLARRKARRGTR